MAIFGCRLDPGWTAARRAYAPLLFAALFALLGFPLRLAAQDAAGLPTLCDGGPEHSQPAQASDPDPSLRDLPRDILNDQKFLWTRPFRPRRGDWLPATVALGVTSGLIAIDRPVGQELSDSPPGDGAAFSRGVGRASGTAVDFGIAASFYLVGRWRNDAKARTTGILALRALTDSTIFSEVLKAASQRPRPTRENGHVRNHNADGEFFAGGSSFPSGHAIRAWALASVIAHQYSRPRWVAPTAYGLAGLVSVSRVTARKHFPSDVFVGSLLGFWIGRHVARSQAKGDGATPRARRWTFEPALLPSGGAGLRLTLEF